MSAVTLVVAHNLVFLLAYGSAYGVALARTGHGATWSNAVAIVVGVAAVLAALAAVQLRRLGLLAGSLTGRAAPWRFRPRSFVVLTVGLWLRLLGASSALFIVQENVERLQADRGLPGLGVLGATTGPPAVVILACVALAVAAVGALFRSRRDVLVARIAAAVRRLLRRSRRILHVRLVGRTPGRESTIGRGRAVRAPPLPAAS